MFDELVKAANTINTETQKVYKVSHDTQALAQTLCVVEEAGEFAGTVRRYMGLARRDGSKQDMQDELADVIISAFVAGAALHIDIQAAIETKLAKVMSRGWKNVNAN